MSGARGLLAAVAVLALSACIPPDTDAPPAPNPAPSTVEEAVPEPVAEAPSAPAYANWRDGPQTPGDWHWRLAGGESIAEFMSPAGQVLLQFHCGGERDMIVALRSTNQSAVALHFRSEAREQTVTADAREGWLVTRLDAHDPLLDAIAFSRGRFAVEARGQALYLPAYPEITRVIEDCR